MLDPFGRIDGERVRRASRSRAAEERERRMRQQADLVQRVAWLAEVSAALLEGRTPDRPAALFVAMAVERMLEGTDPRTAFGIRGVRGSHATAVTVWRAMHSGTQEPTQT